jgi:hypothetical protein
MERGRPRLRIAQPSAVAPRFVISARTLPEPFTKRPELSTTSPGLEGLHMPDSRSLRGTKMRFMYTVPRNSPHRQFQRLLVDRQVIVFRHLKKYFDQGFALDPNHAPSAHENDQRTE